MDVQVKPTKTRKDLGILVSSDVKWSSRVHLVAAKANRMLGFVKRSSSDIHNPRVHCVLYTTLVRSTVVYSFTSSYYNRVTRIWNILPKELVEVYKE